MLIIVELRYLSKWKVGDSFSLFQERYSSSCYSNTTCNLRKYKMCILLWDMWCVWSNLVVGLYSVTDMLLQAFINIWVCLHSWCMYLVNKFCSYHSSLNQKYVVTVRHSHIYGQIELCLNFIYKPESLKVIARYGADSLENEDKCNFTKWQHFRATQRWGWLQLDCMYSFINYNLFDCSEILQLFCECVITRTSNNICYAGGWVHSNK